MLNRSLLSSKRATGCIALSDGRIFWGFGIGAEGIRVGELCFNTSMTGYHEILTDLSYAAQIITFTFPHIGNLSTNEEDLETSAPAARGLIIRENINKPSNWRSTLHLNSWLKSNNLVGIFALIREVLHAVSERIVRRSPQFVTARVDQTQICCSPRRGSGLDLRARTLL